MNTSGPELPPGPGKGSDQPAAPKPAGPDTRGPQAAGVPPSAGSPEASKVAEPAGQVPQPLPPAPPGPKAAPIPKVIRAGTPPVPAEKKPILVLPSTMRRDFILTAIIVVVVVCIIAFSVHKLATDKSDNVLEGIVVEKKLAVPEYGLNSKGINDVDTGFHLRVQVGEHYYLLATLSEQEWNRYKVGDTIKFMKPISEQK